MSLKITGGIFRSRILKMPKGDQTRPTTSMVKQALFNICQGWVEGSRFLDLFAGSGAMGIEAISRGAAFATFVENNRHAASAIKENISMLGIEMQAQLLNMNVKEALFKLSSPYDLIYIDPPYEKDATLVLNTIASQSLLAPRGLLFLEERYDPKAPPETPQGFELVSSRKYGITHLHQYRLSVIEP